MGYSQDLDSLLLPENEPAEKNYVTGAFKSTRVIMSHSMEMLKKGVLDFRILHRFGPVNGGARELFGLDGPASVRLGLDYAISDRFTLGIGRSTHKKELDGFVKFRPIQQGTGNSSAPLSLVLAAGSTINTAKWIYPERKDVLVNRMGYYLQVIAGKKFSDAFSFQLMPSMVHQNLVPEATDDNDIFALGFGGRIKLSKRIAMTADYYYVFNPFQYQFQHPLSIGIDIETGGHVFQLHFTNASGMNERVFITETINNWTDGGVQFGFNISRSFQLKKKNID
jgi:hypothetical protein